ncbi:MAG: phenylacetic acid degradation bifunctional protein PaaZ, partial [Alphaproteobacteria bacterium]
AQYLNGRKEELYALNPPTGATRRDGWIDIDGGIGTLFTYASKGRREMPDGRVYLDGGVEQLSRKGGFMGRHIAVPLQGLALHVNAYNFPVWGMLEKLAPTLLAGVPAVIKPASATAWLAHACYRMIVESGILPEGAVQFVTGHPDALIASMGTGDVLSFTGSAETAARLRGLAPFATGGARFIAEQDSLNASVMGPDVREGSPEWEAMLTEAVREITTKAGQKCTAIRRLIVPADRIDAFAEALTARLEAVRVGDPARDDVDMGALVSRAQRADVLERLARLEAEARRLTGDPAALEPLGADAERGAFLPPILLRCDAPDEARAVHEVEAFGPVSTLMPCRDLGHAAELVGRGGGSLVTSLFTSDPAVARDFALAAARWNGRLYLIDATAAAEATGHGSPLPHMIHGGPGRAGGGEELGGVRGVLHYMQRVAVQGSPEVLTAIGGEWVRGAAERTPPRHPFQMTFDELEIGHTIWTEPRVITLDDIEHFAHFTGDTFYAHMDEEAARRNPFFPGRVAHGYLLLSFAAGLFVEPSEGPVLANTGLDGLSFQKPVSPGDSIRVRLTVKRKTRRTEDYGEVRWNVTMFNQDDEQVAEYELHTMVAYRRPGAGAG